jgi:hypothetical protein
MLNEAGVEIPTVIPGIVPRGGGSMPWAPGPAACKALSQVAVSLISSDITGGEHMPDVLVRDIPDDVLAALDARAGRVGLSRSEYLRRLLTQEATTTASHVGLDDLSRFGEVFSDLAKPDVMAQAWR